MIKMLLPAILIFGLMSCNSEQMKQKNKDSLTTVVNQNKAIAFDLSEINFTENLNTILNGQGIKLEGNKSKEQTILGFDTYVDTSNKLLKFNGKPMSGTFPAGNNQVIIHYNSNSSIIGMYELKVYSQKQADELVSSLNTLFGKPSFEKSDTKSGAIELDENGDEVKSSQQSKKIYKVWENNKTGNSYFLIQTGSGKNIDVELTALNRKSKSAQDWISFRAFDWYKN
jgi:hypothetical protein